MDQGRTDLSATMPVGLATYAADGRCIQANEAMARAVGATVEQLLAQNFRQIASWKPTGLLAAAERVLQTGEVVQLEFDAPTTFGKKVCFECTFARAVIDGEPYLQGVVVDITERKGLLQESEARYRELTNGLEAGVVVHAPDTSIVFANPAARRVIGQPVAEIRGKRANDPRWCFLREDGTPMPVEEYPVSRVLATKERLSQYVVGVAKPDRPPAWYICSAFPSLDVDGELEAVVVSFIDITARVDAEQQRARLDKLESLGLLAGGVAHDFNNMLTMIIANLSLVQDGAVEAEERREMVNEALAAAQRATGLTRQLLTFAAGGAPIKEVGSVGEMVKDSARFALSGSRCSARLEIAEDLWAADVDRGQISQVVENLVINADQAMPAGGEVQVSAENIEAIGEVVELPSELSPGRYIRITVADQGTGIDPRHLDKIFDPFFTTKQKGSGLGLATSFSIVARHGGHLDVSSELAVGTRFAVYLPATTAKPQASEAAAPRRGTGRILVMDDEEPLQRVAKEILDKHGYQAEVVADGASCVAAYRAAREAGEAFRLVLMDLTIPGGMGGKQAVAELRRLDPEVLAIATSGYSNDPVMSDPARFGFCGVVPKPYTAAELCRAVADALMAAD